MMPGVNYVIHGCSSVRTTPGVWSNLSSFTIQDLNQNTGEKIKGKLKIELCMLVDYSY